MGAIVTGKRKTGTAELALRWTAEAAVPTWFVEIPRTGKPRV